MALVTTAEMFRKAYEGGYAIGAFNVNNMELVQGITEAAGELKSPIVLQVSAGARKYANHTYLYKLVEAAIMENEIPIALHLDHGADFEICKACIDGGFTSVMIDGSHHSFEDNIALTKRVVEYAHEKGVVVEGELGQLAGIEDDVQVKEEDAKYTQPDQVEEFVSRTDGIQVPILSLINPIFILSDLTIALIGGLTAIFTSYSKLSKLQENWLNYREVSETLKHEKYLYLSKSGPYSYSGQDDKTIFKLLVERAENIISHENLNWTQVNRSRV